MSVTIGDGTKANKVFSGSAAGTADGWIETTMDGGLITNLYGGGKVSAESTNLTVSGGTIASCVYGGVMADKAGEEITLAGSTLNITGSADIAAYIVGGARVDGGTASVGNVELNITGGALQRDDVYAYTWGAGYVRGGELTVEKATVNLSASLDGDIFAGAHSRNNGSATVENSFVNVTDGTFRRVFGGGWSQHQGTSHVENVKMDISGGTIFAVYAGGANSAENISSIGNAEINVSEDADITNIYLTGRHKEGTVSGNVTLNFNGGTVDYISGITPGGIDQGGTTTAVFSSDIEDLGIDGLDVLKIYQGVTVNMIEEIDFTDFQKIQFVINDIENFDTSWTALTSDIIINDFDKFNISFIGADANEFKYDLASDKKGIVITKNN